MNKSYYPAKDEDLIDAIKMQAMIIEISLRDKDYEKANIYAYGLAEVAQELKKRTQARYYEESDK